MWYKAVPVGRNTLAKQMKTIASIASLDGKFTNSSGRKTVIQSLREDFHPLEISELTISSYSHNPLEKQQRMSNKLAGFSSSTTTTVTAANASGGPHTEALREVYVNSPALPSVVGNNTAAMDNGSDGLTARALGGLFTNVSVLQFSSEYFHQVAVECSSQRFSQWQLPAVKFLQMKASEFLDF